MLQQMGVQILTFLDGLDGLLFSCGRISATGRVDTVECFGTGLSCLQEQAMSTLGPGSGSAPSGPLVSAVGQPALFLCIVS